MYDSKLIDESYKLCNRLKQMMLCFQQSYSTREKYGRVQAIHRKAFRRYQRRWRIYTTGQSKMS